MISCAVGCVVAVMGVMCGTICWVPQSVKFLCYLSIESVRPYDAIDYVGVVSFNCSAFAGFGKKGAFGIIMYVWQLMQKSESTLLIWHSRVWGSFPQLRHLGVRRQLSALWLN
ncbi:hypothetical protein TNIN_398541 [Trichonephila inaurata madagascariensis]|uniref:Uncharacterized protein n=1 Tax=Trichonephila inaurata madagascariensis TaxID=2747483 RepID=A0A8X6JQ74_9ARAC|nr:hypothetical protein TNIN_398541 [Trichonephila inaurata madagascariensis]